MRVSHPSCCSFCSGEPPAGLPLGIGVGCPCQLWCRGADAKPSTNVQVSSTNVFHSRWLPLLLILPVASSIKYSFELAQPRPFVRLMASA